jgi:hypothetical protein
MSLPLLLIIGGGHVLDATNAGEEIQLKRGGGKHFFRRGQKWRSKDSRSVEWKVCTSLIVSQGKSMRAWRTRTSASLRTPADVSSCTLS